MNTRETILRILRENEGRFISGEQLSESLGISRTAVWKHILALKGEGYQISSISRRGYQLVGSSDIYDRSAIISQLNTKILAHELVFLTETDSTNNELKRLAAAGAPEGTVVIAEKQLTGRGRRGRAWNSEPGQGIYLSILLRPDIEPENVQAITLAASSAVCRAVEPYTRTKPGIKWPNDILLDNKKVCGILTEMNAEPDKVHSIILGIGINVTQQLEDFPQELRETATSLALHSRGNLSRSQLVVRVLKEFEDLYLDFVTRKSTARFLNIWRSFSVTIGYDIMIIQGDKTWQARALDVLDDGRLLVETAGGSRQAVSSGEISIRKADIENNGGVNQ